MVPPLEMMKRSWASIVYTMDKAVLVVGTDDRTEAAGGQPVFVVYERIAGFIEGNRIVMALGGFWVVVVAPRLSRSSSAGFFVGSSVGSSVGSGVGSSVGSSTGVELTAASMLIHGPLSSS